MTLQQELATQLTNSENIIIFTGAGMSTDSGIPDFRSPGGKWSKVTPVLFNDFMNDDDSRFEYWRQKSESFAEFGDACPNAGHRLLADWEQQGLVHGIVTQNIDGLHQDAGSNLVIEIHGTAREVQCMHCDFRDTADEYCKSFLDSQTIPHCPACETGLLKHATISFGQELNENVHRSAIKMVKAADLLIVMGSSLSVEPAASLPVIAKQYGAQLAIINRDSTQLDSLADILIKDNITNCLEAIDRLLNA